MSGVNRIPNILLIMAATSLFGCAATAGRDVKVNRPDPAVVKLAEVAESIAAYDRKLSAIAASQHYRATGETISEFDFSLLPGLNQVVSLGASWNGPLDKLLIELSVLAGLNPPRFINRKPPAGIMVSLNTDYRKIIDMILDSESQTAQANISLKMRERLLEIEYVYYH